MTVVMMMSRRRKKMNMMTMARRVDWYLQRFCVVGVQAAPLLSHLGFYIINYLYLGYTS